MAGPILVLQNDASDPVGPLGEWLADAGATLEIRDLSSGAGVPDELVAFGGVVVLGGGMSATDDARTPWLPAVRALLRDAVAQEVPVLAVCLGAQLLAVATGGTVGRNPDGPEYGAGLIAKRAASAGDPLFGPLPITPDVIQWHQDAVLRLPPGAQLLATSVLCEVQAFRLGRLAWGVQFHLETTPELVRSWADEDVLRLEGYDVAALLERSDAAHADVAETWAPFAAAFAGVVADPSAVRAPRPIGVATAAPITDPAQIRAALAEQMRSAQGHAAAAAASLPWPATSPTGVEPDPSS